MRRITEREQGRQRGGGDGDGGAEVREEGGLV